ncbi:DUF3971 domain-containing protein [Aquicoccus sp. G2-2]|uniref:YhdP family protein n=1 Tax=Aquicoccus sp. G2-2 TaxID=3092120 RepID=UPI002AE0AF22|nr:DUF3971 domain-containing protein [Aquicoccus sp. G2-2]MEA1113443.1 DUF3971 domain-containing protein [Aquicoccus sp. G2-2]
MSDSNNEESAPVSASADDALDPHVAEKPPAADSSDESADVEVSETPEEARERKSAGHPPKRRRWRRAVLYIGLLVIVLAVGLGVAGLIAVGRPIEAPGWLKTRIEAQVNQRLGGARIALGHLSFIMEPGWHPRVKLRDVEIADLDGRHVVTLSDLVGTLALRPLLSGKVQPAHIWLSGAQLVLRRDVSGNVELSFGGTDSSGRAAASFVELIEEADRALVTPALADLKSLSADGLTIRYEDARAGRAWTVDGGRVAVTRAGDDLTIRGDLSLLSGGASAATIELTYESLIGSPQATFGMNFSDVPASDIAVQSASLLWLNVLRAKISGALRGGTDASGKLGPLSATLRIGKGVLQPTEETEPIPFRSARSYFTYLPDTQTMQFDELSIDSAWGAIKADGKVTMGALKNGLPEEFVSQMRVSEIKANPMHLYPQPITFSNATMATRLQLNPFRLSLGEMTLNDGASRLDMRGELRAEPKGWDLSVTGGLNKMGPERLLQLWPKSLVPNTRKWVETNILDGVMTNIQIGLRSEPEHKPVMYLGFEFEKLHTLFMKAMPPIEDGRGHATLFKNRFTVVAEAGHVDAAQGGAVDITGTVFTVPDVRIKQAPAQVDLSTRSTITAALTLLDRAPFHFLSKSGLKPTLSEGQVKATGRINFPMKNKVPFEDIEFDAKAKLSGVRSETLVPGRVLSAPALAVTATPKHLHIEGEGMLDAVPVSGTFSAPLGPDGGGVSQVKGTVELSQRFVDEFKLGLPNGSVSGKGRGAVQIDFRRGTRPKFTLHSDLSGVGLRIVPISWAMSGATRGTLDVSGTLGEPVEVNHIALDAPGLKATGRLDLGQGGVFRQAVFDRVRVGSWLDSKVTLTGRGAGRSPAVQVSGGTVDLSQTEIGSGTGSGATGGASGGPLSVAVDRLKITNSIALTGFRGEFSTAKGMDGSFAGKVNGSAAVTGRVVPKGGRSAFRILSKDAGSVFRAAGLLENAHGGDLDLTLLPSVGTGIFDGTLKAKKVRLRKAPAMAELLNAISVVGLLDQLSGTGILFNDIDARFRLSPKQVTLLKSSAVGTSMGISMDGYYYFDNGTMRFQGFSLRFICSMGSARC